MPPNDNSYINSNSPIVEGRPEIFSRVWFRFFDAMAAKMSILAGVFSTSATAGGASALPATPAGYMTIIDGQGVTRKVPYYNE